MSRSKLSGSVTGSIEWEGYEIQYTAKVSGEYYFQKGRMYMPNGDPGYPDEEEYEGPFFEYVDWNSILDKDGVELENCEEIYKTNQEVIDLAIQRDVENNKEWDNCSWDEAEPPEPPEREPPEED